MTADCYPYNAWSSTITVLVPDKRYDYPPSVERALADVGGAGNVLIVRHAAHPDYEFKTLEAVARSRGVTPVEQFIQIVKDGGAGVVCTSMVDDDIRAFYRQPWVMVGSDGGIGVRHPRGAGTFPKVLGRYVRELHWLTLPEAIRKMTSMPADRLQLRDRGRIAAGTIADLVLLNPSDRGRSVDVQRSHGAADRHREGLRRRASWCGTPGSRCRLPETSGPCHCDTVPASPLF